MPTLTLKKIKRIVRKLSTTNLRVPQIAKQGKNTCWAGCYRMANEHHFKNKKPFSHYLKLQGHGCTNTFCNITPCKTCDQARNTTDIFSDLKSLNFKNTVHHSTYLNTKDINRYLKDNNPILVFKEATQQMGHYLIISGITHINLFSEQRLIINDPDKSEIDIINTIDFCNSGGRWSQTWVVRP